MKKLSMILALVLALALVMTGCGTKKDDTAADAPAVSEDAAATENTEDTAEGGTLVMATNAEFPPYEYHEGDEIVGIDAEIAAAIAEKLGMELQVEDMAFDSLIPAIQSNKADMVLAGMTVTEDRLENVNFSDSYATGVQVVIVKEDSDIKSVDDLFAEGANHSIGVQTATTGDIYTTDDIEGAGLGTVERFNTGADAVQALLTDKIDCVVIDNEPAKAFVAANEGLVILDTEYVTEDYAIAVAKGNDELLAKLNEALTALTEDGTIPAIIEKYIPSGAAEDKAE